MMTLLGIFDGPTFYIALRLALILTGIGSLIAGIRGIIVLLREKKDYDNKDDSSLWRLEMLGPIGELLLGIALVFIIPWLF